jgi:hypothetical protein
MKVKRSVASLTCSAHAVLVIATTLAALTSVSAFAQKVVVVPTAPPPVRAEVVPRVRPGYAWDGGHWRWAPRGYVWEPGHWRRVRPGYRWAPGHWAQSGPNWRWIDGHWVP